MFLDLLNKLNPGNLRSQSLGGQFICQKFRPSLRYLIAAFEIALIITLSWQLAKLSWLLLDNSSPQLNDWNPEAASSTSEAQQKNLYPNLKNFQFFGQEPVRLNLSDSNLPDPNNVPRSRLSARVTGIVASPDPGSALAVIRTGAGEKTYRINDSLTGTSAKIEDIYPDRVIVLNRGEHEALLLYPDEVERRVARRTSTQLHEIRQRLITEPSSLSESLNEFIRISPYLSNGTHTGYQLSPGANPELFQAAGLETGDIAIAVNEVNLTDAREARALIKTLPELTGISLTIERNGRLFEIDLPL